MQQRSRIHLGKIEACRKNLISVSVDRSIADCAAEAGSSTRRPHVSVLVHVLACQAIVQHVHLPTSVGVNPHSKV